MKIIRPILIVLFLFSFIPKHQSQIIVSLIFGEALNTPNMQFGIEVGANATTVLNSELADYTSGFEIGMFLNWKFKDKWALYSNLIANSNRGYRGDFSNISSDFLPANDYEFSYMKIRLIYGGIQSAMRYYISPSFSLAAGINAGLKFKALNQSYFKKGDTDLSVEYKVNSDYALIDVGPVFSAMYQFKKGKGLSVVARAYYGLVDVDLQLPGNQNTLMFQLTAGILIGAKKAKDVVMEIEEGS